MQKTWAALLLAAVMAPVPSARAADHRDGPNSINSPEGDLNDIYTWMSPDAKTVYLALTVIPNAGKPFTSGGPANPARFSNALKYVMNINSRPSDNASIQAGATGLDARARFRIIATFDTGTPQKMQLWLVNVNNGSTVEYVSGDPSGAAGITSGDGKLRVFAGLRDDPFFFNLQGLFDFETYYHDNESFIPAADGAGCRPLGRIQQNAAITYLGPNFGTGADFFASFNTLAIVVTVDKTLLTTTGPLLSVWASTHR